MGSTKVQPLQYRLKMSMYLRMASDEQHLACARARGRLCSCQGAVVLVPGGGARSVPVRRSAVKIKKRFLGDRPTLLDNLQRRQPNTNRRRQGPPHNIDRFEHEAVRVHYDDDVCLGLCVLQPMDDTHRFVVGEIRVFGLIDRKHTCEQRAQHTARLRGSGRRTMSQAGATCVFTVLMR
jgi:hypothetical protein